MYNNGHISHWLDQHPRHRISRAKHPPKSRQDLVIAGGGLSGLWTAYYAKKRFPNWKISILEAHTIGYGASGRNGGWMSTLLPGKPGIYEKAANLQGKDGKALVSRFQQVMIDSIYEALDVLVAEDIAADQKQGGQVLVASTPAELRRAHRAFNSAVAYGYGDADLRILSRDEVKSEINLGSALGGLKYSHTVSLDPAKLTLGLASAVEKMGVEIYENTRVDRIAKGVVFTDSGMVATEHAISTLESYSNLLEGTVPGTSTRSVIPVNSSMIITRPIADHHWQRIGWNQGQCLMDAAHTFIYAQRTADNRIAIGGRGNPYRYGSGHSGQGAVDSRTVRLLSAKLQSLFPKLPFEVAHTWRGTIGVTRDWCAGLYYNEENGIGTVRGDAGHGVTATNLAARTLVDRIVGDETELTQMPWNDHHSGIWEPEPLRWLGVHSMYRLFGIADSYEQKRNLSDTSLIARAAGRIAGVDT